MDQQSAWDREYKSQKLLSPSNVPQADVMRFVRWMKKERRKRIAKEQGDTGEVADVFSLEGVSVLDLGSGTGRNAYYFASEGAEVLGLEFSPTAVAMAKATAEKGGLSITYRLQSIGTTYPLPNASVNIALDSTSSNSLSDAERHVYLKELSRVLVPGGFLFLRALSLERDANAKELIKRFPGPDPDTYVHPDLKIVEKVFSRDVLERTYKPYFDILELKRIEHYATVSGRVYKRSYWIAYMQKPLN